MNDLGIGDKFEEHIRICMTVGELLSRAKAACDAGQEPDPSIAPEINALFEEGETLALEIGTALMPATTRILGSGKNRVERIVKAYTNYAKKPSEETYDRILEIILGEFEVFKKAKMRSTIIGKMMRYQ
jgi:hypothetical protein